MSHTEWYRLTGLVLLGAVHGINPAMGWLFAVARGCQESEKREGRRAVWGSFGPLAAGHALAIGAAIALGAMFGTVVPLPALRWLVAAALVTRGLASLVRHWHPRAGGLRV